MPTTDKRIDTYINKAAPFAQPVLKHLRGLVHQACPGVTETIKWGFPHFEYSGEIVCSMASFKQHCVFGFWKAAIMKDPDRVLTLFEKASMGHLGRITSKKDLPGDRILKKYIKEAAALNEAGVKLPSRTAAKPAAGSLEVPDYIKVALKQNKKAAAVFEAFSPSHKKEYIQWITEAKTEPTREKRINTMLEWLEEGKPMHWKYVK
ncbi:MAG: YdeI/OmpD-associated family protein [Chitinophagaceae bacterium]|nr:YdeI/OmpD-associated family protein [Chitinophagaceae bacterium]